MERGDADVLQNGFITGTILHALRFYPMAMNWLTISRAIAE